MAAAVATRHSSKVPVSLGLCLILCLASPGGLMAANHEALKADAEQFFRDRVTPFIKTYCLDCHSEQATDGGRSQFLASAQELPVTRPSANSGRKRSPG